MAARKPLWLSSGRPTELSAADTLPASAIPFTGLTFLGTATVGESALITLGLSVRRYTVTTITVAAGARIIAVNNGVPSNGSLQDVYVAGANNINVGALIPVLGVAATVSVPLAFYLIN